MKPRISLLVTELSMGGAAKVVRDHAQAFRSFADVREIVFNRADGVDFPGDKVISLDVDGGGGLLNRLANLVRRVRRYRTLKDEWQPDISIAHLEGAYYVDLLSRRFEKNVIVMHGSVLHNKDFAGLIGMVRRKLLIPMALRRADAVVAVSRDIAAEMASVGIPGVRTINNFFDVQRIKRLAAAPLPTDHESLFAGPPVILTAARLAAAKNQAPLLDAFAILRQERDARLVFLGDGPLRSDLLDHARKLGLRVSSPWTNRVAEADVHFVGVRENPFAYIARASLFALPSAWEGFPLVLCESMACETAVVSADCPTGPREILAPDSPTPSFGIDRPEPTPVGMLMPIPISGASSTTVWAETMINLLDDEELRTRMAAAAGIRVRDFTAATVVPQWRRLVEELFEQEPSKM